MPEGTLSGGSGMLVEKLTPEQHKQAVKFGIKLRSDGMWGFKKKCHNPQCESVIEDHCYCAPTFAEAVDAVKERSAWSCSDRCWGVTGGAECMFDGLDADDIRVYSGVKTWIDPHTDRLVRKLREGKPLTARERTVFDAVRDEGDFDWDLDDGECGCDV